ncbi:glycosyltransferase [uncultured Sphingomonas sp.]|uniref:glycosyltransferase n=1 Tax=uncultured Sphingomonas sp. TaxID=158754 RepID=UPI0025F7EB9D|nr:glycosyltransferase [uncultured Sphingomonas sp.]
MKILHIITGLRTGGAEMMLHRLATAPTPGTTHEVISLRGWGTVGARLQEAGVPVTSVDMFGASTPLAFLRLIAAIRRSKPDLVQTWLYHADVMGGLAARLAGAKRIVWGIRTADIRVGIGLSRGAGLMLRAAARMSRTLPERIVYVAEAARIAHEACGYDPAKSLVIHNGFRLPDPEDCARGRASVRREIGVSPDALLIGTAGTFNAQKNQVGFVHACAPSLAKRADLHVLLIGRGNDAASPELVDAVRATGHADRIHLLGERRDVSDCLAALDIFCLASRGEGFPNVVGEAMAVGTSAVVTDVGDAALLVADTGTVVPVDDPVALAAALAGQVDLPRAILAERGQAARDRIARDFTMDQVKDRYHMLYHSPSIRGKHS